MVPFYKKIGFLHTGLRHTEPHWKDERILNIMIVKTFDLVMGRGVNPFYWNMLWRDVSQYLSAQSVVEPTGIDRARLVSYRSIAPLADTALQAMRLMRP